MPETQQLYPVFEIPAVRFTDTDAERGMKAGPLFDFDTGDFVRDGANRVVMVDGRDQYILWCLKALKTQWNACQAYPDHGIDFDGALEKPDRKAVQSALERTVTEALANNASTERVYGFEYHWETDGVQVTFVVKPKLWEAFDINMNVVI